MRELTALVSKALLLDKYISYNNAGSISEIDNKAGPVSAGANGMLGGQYLLSNINYNGMNQVTSLNQQFGLPYYQPQ